MVQIWFRCLAASAASYLIIINTHNIIVTEREREEREKDEVLDELFPGGIVVEFGLIQVPHLLLEKRSQPARLRRAGLGRLHRISGLRSDGLEHKALVRQYLVMQYADLKERTVLTRVEILDHWRQLSSCLKGVTRRKKRKR
jgi:hypothetical protein